MALTYLGLGTNLGNKQQNLNDAIAALSVEVGGVMAVSSFMVSAPWGFDSENAFLNAVVLMETNLTPFGLLQKTQEIERELGRTTKPSNGYSDRIIDIDILLYNNLIINELTLKIPHPLITERDFVLVPLMEISPDLVNPISNKRYSEIIFQG